MTSRTQGSAFDLTKQLFSVAQYTFMNLPTIYAHIAPDGRLLDARTEAPVTHETMGGKVYPTLVGVTARLPLGAWLFRRDPLDPISEFAQEYYDYHDKRGDAYWLKYSYDRVSSWHRFRRVALLKSQINRFLTEKVDRSGVNPPMATEHEDFLLEYIRPFLKPGPDREFARLILRSIERNGIVGAAEGIRRAATQEQSEQNQPRTGTSREGTD